MDPALPRPGMAGLKQVRATAVSLAHLKNPKNPRCSLYLRLCTWLTNTATGLNGLIRCSRRCGRRCNIQIEGGGLVGGWVTSSAAFCGLASGGLMATGDSRFSATII